MQISDFAIFEVSGDFLCVGCFYFPYGRGPYQWNLSVSGMDGARTDHTAGGISGFAKMGEASEGVAGFSRISRKGQSKSGDGRKR